MNDPLLQKGTLPFLSWFPFYSAHRPTRWKKWFANLIGLPGGIDNPQFIDENVRLLWPVISEDPKRNNEPTYHCLCLSYRRKLPIVI